MLLSLCVKLSDLCLAFVWDLVILTLTILGLRRQEVYQPTRLASVLCTQGVLYALVSGLSAIPVVVRYVRHDIRYMVFNRCLAGNNCFAHEW